MFCKECGIKIPDDAQFCPFCGEVLEMEVKSQIDAHTLDNKLEDDFDLHLDWVTETAVLRQDMQTKIFLQVAKNTSAPVAGAKVQLSGPPQVNIVIKSRKIHPKKTINKIIFLISAEEPGLFTLTATLTSSAGHRIAFPFKIRVEPSKTLYREEKLIKTTINNISKTDFKLYLDGGVETVFLHQSTQKIFFLMVSKRASFYINYAKVQISGPPHVDIIIQSRKIQANIKKNLVSFTISAKELGVFTLTATLTSDAGHRIAYPFKIRVEPTNFIYGDSPTIDSSSEPDFKLYLDGGVETVFLHQKMRKKFFLNVEKNISSPVYGGEVQLSGPPHVDIIIPSKKIQANKKRNVVFFTISANELGVFTLTATLTSDAGHRIAFPFKIRVEPTNFSYVEESRAKQAIHSTPTPSKGENEATILIIFGLIGGVMFLAGIMMLFGGAFSIGITLMIIGTIFCFIVITIGTNGNCFNECCCEGCTGC